MALPVEPIETHDDGSAVLPGDVLADIFLRLSPLSPTPLIRCAAVCRDFYRVASDHVFRRLLRDHCAAPAPPLLGFFRCVHSAELRPSACASDALSPALRAGVAASHLDFLPGDGKVSIVDVRAGHALVRVSAPDDPIDLVVCKPLAKTWRAVPTPHSGDWRPNYRACALLPSDDEKGASFRIAALIYKGGSSPSRFQLCVFSSGTNRWRYGDASVDFLGPSNSSLFGPSVVVNDDWHFLHKEGFIVAMDLANMTLSKIDLPDPSGEDGGAGASSFRDMSPVLGRTPDGRRLRLFAIDGESLCIWERADHAAWTKVKDVPWTTELHREMIPFRAVPRRWRPEDFVRPKVRLLACGESTGLLLVQAWNGVLTFDASTARAQVIHEMLPVADYTDVFPYEMEWPPAFPSLGKPRWHQVAGDANRAAGARRRSPSR